MSCLNELLTCWSECSIDVYRIPYFATVEIDAKQRSHSPYTVHHSTSFTFLAIFLQDKIYMYMGLIPKAIKLYHCLRNCSDVTMDAMASQITSLTVVYSTVYSGADKKNQSSASLAFVRGIHRWPVNSAHKGTVTRKMFPFDDVIMRQTYDRINRAARQETCAKILTSLLLYAQIESPLKLTMSVLYK